MSGLVRMSRRLVVISVLLVVSGAASAGADQYDPPPAYYSTATGSGATLKSQLFTITSTDFHARDYGAARYSMGSGSLSNMSPGGYTDMDLVQTGSLLLAYNRDVIDAQWHNGASTSFNREHVWPKSWLNLTSNQVDNNYTGIASDAFELRPSNPNINSTRGNLGYGGSPTATNYGISGAYFYPGTADTGDV